MKKTIAILLSLLVLLAPVLAFADISDLPTERQQPLLVDEGDILTDSEEALLLAELERISAEQKCDVAVLIPRSLGYKTATEYADDFYDQNGFGQGELHDGILLLVCMEERDWATSTAGAAQDWFDDYTLNGIEDAFLPYLSNGQYYDAFSTFASRCETVLKGVDRREVLYLSDLGGFLTPDQAALAVRTLESHSHVASCDIVFMTVQSLDGKTAEKYIDDVYGSGAYRHDRYSDRVVMLVDRAASICYAITGGSAAQYFTEDDLNSLQQTVANSLSAGDPMQAVNAFAAEAYQKIDAYQREHFNPGGNYTPRTPQVLSGGRAFFSLLIGGVVGLIVAFSLKKQLKSVYSKTAASGYMRKNSMQLTEQQDLYLYANVTKTPRQTDSGRSGHGGGGGGSHFSSSGISHGGHSGKF